MLKEVSKAVEVFHKIAFKHLEAKHLISDSQVRAFLSIFTELLVVRYEKFWFPDEPDRASGYRCIRVNRQSIDPVVAESLRKAGIPKDKHKQIISSDVTVWVDPGVVSMRIGEDGSVGQEVLDEQLYAKNLAKRGNSSKPKDAEEDEGICSRSPSPPDTPSSSSSADSSTPSRHLGSLKKLPPPPPQEYNPYNMSAQVCNASRGVALRQGMSSPHPNHLQPQHRTMSPPTNIYSAPPSATQQRLCRPVMPQGSGLVAPQSSSGAGMYRTNGHIPISASPFPSARRNVFGENGGMSHQDSFGKMVPRDFAMAMNFQGNPPRNYMDIPVMA
ncbi:protein btg1 [Plakobranchus ocellatus]|uniref:Protein btg1 n=1 Tax=Plakobranchus ocellatus TaxID=259542 RepID=A0AAV4DKZ7_9GAST|nr:protein btg1 [Plakobranchus ocellatus]